MYSTAVEFSLQYYLQALQIGEVKYQCLLGLVWLFQKLPYQVLYLRLLKQQHEGAKAFEESLFGEDFEAT